VAAACHTAAVWHNARIETRARISSDLLSQMAAHRSFGTTGSCGFASASPVLADPESRVLCLEARYTPRVANPITVYVPGRNTLRWIQPRAIAKLLRCLHLLV